MQKKTLLSGWIKQPARPVPVSNEKEVSQNTENSVETGSNAHKPEVPVSVKPKIDRKASVRGWSSIFKSQKRFLVTLKLPGWSKRQYTIKNMPISEAPFSIVRVNHDLPSIASNINSHLKPLAKRSHTHSNENNLNIITGIPTTFPSNTTIKDPSLAKRRIIPLETVQTYLENRNLDCSATQNCFDLGEFETQMWDKKHAPSTPQQHFNPVQTANLRQWIALKLAGQHDQEEIMVLNGPHGSGKTSAVYAACLDTNAYVFEVNTANKRSAKNLTSLLEGIAHNHAVHNAKNAVVLIDEADIVFDNEAGTFWPFISKFAKTSKRPIIITCESQQIFGYLTTETLYKTLFFMAPPLDTIADHAYKVLIMEGHILEFEDVKKFVQQNRNDLRRVLASLQFWCQMGLGDSSGQYWAAKQHEIEGSNRIMSENTYIPLDFGEEKLYDPLENAHSLEEAMESCESLSTANLPKLDPEIGVVSYDELLYGPEELKLCEFYTDPSQSVPNARKLVNPLETDINPYLRYIAVYDYMRDLQVQKLIEQNPHHSVRLLRRAWASQGIDVRQHLGLQPNALQLILRRSYKSKFYQ